jgi:rSAM/selenodomain-associated transferase 1
MSGCGLAIFVKTPALSPAKTRLWPALGRARAEALYLECAAAVASVAEQAQRASAVQPYWAVAEAEGLDAPIWQRLPRLSQGEGGLGARMAGVYSQLLHRHDAAVLIGADAPQLQASMLAQAAAWLDAAVPRLVLGRAEDGGFWLFGGNVALDAAAWECIAYSRADTAACFQATFNGCGDWLQLPALRDLDTIDDLAPVHAALAALHAPTPEQRRVANWLDDALAPAGAPQWTA